MDRIKLVSKSVNEFEKLLSEKGWSVDTSTFSIKQDDINYHKVIYFIFISDDDNVIHLVYGNDSYRNVLKSANSFACGGGLMSTYITTIPRGFINQIDFSESGIFPEIFVRSEKSSINFDTDEEVSDIKEPEEIVFLPEGPNNL